MWRNREEEARAPHPVTAEGLYMFRVTQPEHEYNYEVKFMRNPRQKHHISLSRGQILSSVKEKVCVVIQRKNSAATRLLRMKQTAAFCLFSGRLNEDA